MTMTVEKPKTAKEAGLPLDQFYRPTKLEQVIGQDVAIEALKKNIRSPRRHHTFLFTGPTGTGKTTCARILKSELATDNCAYLELDAAQHGSIDNIREIIDTASLMPMNGKTKYIVLDEVHEIHTKTWSAILKSLENPPAHVFYALCTTEYQKIPKTILTRCFKTELHLVSTKNLTAYGMIIDKKESLGLDQATIQEIAAASGGSVRQLLQFLGQCDGADLESVRQIIKSSEANESDPIIELCRKLPTISSNSWPEFMSIINRIENWGAVVPRLNSYYSKVVESQPTTKNFVILDSIDKMPEYLDEKTGKAKLQLFLGRVLMS